MPSTLRTRSNVLQYALSLLLPVLLLVGAGALTGSESEAGESKAGKKVAKATSDKDKDKDKKKDPPAPPPPLDESLAVRHALTVPVRLTQGPTGKFYVTDARIGSVFIYESDLTLIGELKGLDKPLGIAVTDTRDIIVGCDGTSTIEVFDLTGASVRTISSTAAHPIKMPNDIALDRDENLYVADSKRNRVEVYDSAGAWVRTIGAPVDTYTGLSFPCAVAIAYRTVDGVESGEIYVADQGGVQIQVFGFDGTHLRSFGSAIAEFSEDWQGKYTRLQDLAFDSQGRLHVLDNFLRRVQLVDPVTGTYLGVYGAYEPDDTRLKLPLGLVLASDGRAIVADATTKSLEVFTTWPQTEPE
jgi:DNA-binding beta-propeller fold protein YncE